MADIVQFSRPPADPPKTGGMREAALDYWKSYAAKNEICDCSGGWSEMMADNLLAFLWNEGFKIVPLGPGDPEYDGPDWTGEERPAA